MLPGAPAPSVPSPAWLVVATDSASRAAATAEVRLMGTSEGYAGHDAGVNDRGQVILAREASTLEGSRGTTHSAAALHRSRSASPPSGPQNITQTARSSL